MSFTAEKAKAKFAILNATQQSIQSTSQWCLFHYKYAKEIVDLWVATFEGASDDTQLNLFYLCNDIMQHSRRSSDKYGYISAFSPVLNKVMQKSVNKGSPLVAKYIRVFEVWRQRQILPNDQIDILVKEMKTKNVKESAGSGENVNSNSNNVPGAIPSALQPLTRAYKNLPIINRSDYTKFHTSATVCVEAGMTSDVPHLLDLSQRLESQYRDSIAKKEEVVVHLQTILDQLQKQVGEERSRVEHLVDLRQQLQEINSNSNTSINSDQFAPSYDDADVDDDEIPQYGDDDEEEENEEDAQEEDNSNSSKINDNNNNNNNNNDNTNDDNIDSYKESKKHKIDVETSAEPERKKKKVSFATEESSTRVFDKEEPIDAKQEAWNSLNSILKQLT
ncbi:hypothetical protein DAMA08_047610 [Martiniozyma asiatica (nom. inval.)]|nr:hypothetical protein DAMA08_047610 [Martiniozyma asiatica]